MTEQNVTRKSFMGSPVQIGALVVGIAFLLAGLMGFIPGITTNFETMQFAGHESEAMLLGIFQVSILHNLVHALFGIVGIAMARLASTARAFLIVGGVIYLILWIYGLVIDHESAANFVPLNEAVDWLHFALGLGMVALGLILPRLARNRTDRPTHQFE